MAYYFSEAIDAAIDALYRDHDIQKGRRVFLELQKLAAQGDADAKYLLSRCYSGSCFVWEEFEFPENDELAYRNLMEAVRGGSAMAVLGALRLSGVSEEETARIMPFRNFKEPWDIIYKKAREGCAFCQYLIGNTYYWLDVLLIDNIDLARDFPDRESARRRCAELVREGVPWLEKAICAGIGFAARNLASFYRKGREGLIAPQPEKEVSVMKLAAEHGSVEWMYFYGRHLLDSFETEREGLQYCLRAAEGGQSRAWYEVARVYNEGLGVPRDRKKALLYAEKGLGHPWDDYCCDMVGMLCFEGFDGIPIDYPRAVKMLQRAKDADPSSTWENDRLAVCYVLGLGCQPDIPRAMRLLREIDHTNAYTSFVYGIVYTQGLCVPQDIKKGVEYLQKSAQSFPRAQEELKKFRRTWYGKWVRAE